MLPPPDPSPVSLLACLQQALGHELPNQLVVLQGLVRLLETEEGQHLSPDGHALVNRLACAARRTHDVVVALAALVRQERRPALSESLTLDEALSEAIAEAKLLCSDLRVVYDSPSPAPPAAVSRSAFHQVLVHLLRQLAPVVRVVVDVSPSEIALRLISQGTFRPDPRLFEPFAQATGTGLEWFTAAYLAASWGGGLRWEESPSSPGSFLLTIPRA